MFGYDANGYYGYGEFTNEAEEPKKLAHLDVKRVESALFYTATHRSQVWVGTTLIAESPESSQRMRDDELRVWVRSQIQQNRHQLHGLNVDVQAEFARFGGNPNDLYMY